MTTFRNAVLSTPVMTTTTNGMVALQSTMSKSVDLFFKIGASRGKSVTAQFEQAFQENPAVALRIAQWARDVRGGAGERQIYRDILKHLEVYHKDVLLETTILQNTAEIGRWDDLLIFSDPDVKKVAFTLIAVALTEKNALAAKWAPRKGPVAEDLRKFLGLTPRSYRKLLVGLSNTVETQMCARDWDEINFSHVPSLAMSRYTKAFNKKAPATFASYKAALVKGDPEVKVNAAAVYPYDIIKSLRYGDREMADQQWKALPNYMSDAMVLPMVDVSGSMQCSAGGSKTITCLDVALSLGLYCSDKNTGPFKDLFLTFSSQPQLVPLRGTLSEKMHQMQRSSWAMSTNLNAAFDEILRVAVGNRVEASQMPKILLILSDMQFNSCVDNPNNTAMGMITDKYQRAGYELPKVVFWNLNSHDNVPVKFNEQGTALVSGFSPSIMRAVLAADMDDFTPEAIMMKTIMSDRYNIDSI